MPRGVQRAETRQDLLAAAAATIEEAGIDGLTVRAVTHRAGCASGVLYNYFDDLDDLVAALVASSFAETIAAARAIVAEPGSRPVEDVLRELATAFVHDRSVRLASAAMGRSGVLARVREQFAADDEPNPDALSRVVADYLRSEQRRSRVAKDADVDTGAWILVAALHEVLVAEPLDRNRTRVDIDRIITTLLRGLAPRRR